jgi:hypothetical protein
MSLALPQEPFQPPLYLRVRSPPGEHVMLYGPAYRRRLTKPTHATQGPYSLAISQSRVTSLRRLSHNACSR